MSEDVPPPTSQATDGGLKGDVDGPKRDSIWMRSGVIATVLGVLATVGISFWIYDHQRSTKSLEYGVISNGPLASIQDNLNGRLKVSFDNQPVPNVNLVILSVTNDGTIPIQQQDFVRPVRLFFGLQPKAQVLSAEVSNVAPSGVTAGVSFKADTVTLAPTLLNSGDRVTLRILLAGAMGKLEPMPALSECLHWNVTTASRTLLGTVI